jgi:hypothetical protein
MEDARFLKIEFLSTKPDANVNEELKDLMSPFLSPKPETKFRVLFRPLNPDACFARLDPKINEPLSVLYMEFFSAGFDVMVNEALRDLV